MKPSAMKGASARAASCFRCTATTRNGPSEPEASSKIPAPRTSLRAARPRLISEELTSHCRAERPELAALTTCDLTHGARKPDTKLAPGCAPDLERTVELLYQGKNDLQA